MNVAEDGGREEGSPGERRLGAKLRMFGTKSGG